MKKLILLIALYVAALSCFADTVFKKDKGNGAVEMKFTGDTIDFSINTESDGAACNIDGKALIIDDHRAAFTPDDMNDLCAIVFNFESETQLKVTAKDCDGYCGLQAKGTISGTYQKH